MGGWILHVAPIGWQARSNEQTPDISGTPKPERE